ncbi:MAG: molybdopterin-binding protein, partial [Bacteroidota bacterium]
MRYIRRLFRRCQWRRVFPVFCESKFIVSHCCEFVAKVIITNNLYQTIFLVNAHLLTIGDEILIGQIIDTNSAWMSRQLNLIGVSVNGKSSVGDTRSDI